jgi:hypothetical protein
MPISSAPGAADGILCRGKADRLSSYRSASAMFLILLKRDVASSGYGSVANPAEVSVSSLTTSTGAEPPVKSGRPTDRTG